MSLDEIYLTIEEAADLLKVNPRHIKRMISAGELRAKDVSVGTGQRKFWRVLKKDVLMLQDGTYAKRQKVDK